MLEISRRIFANENEAYVVGDVNGQAVVKKMGQWGFVTPDVLADDGNESALRILRSILPAGMTVKTDEANNFSPAEGIVALLKGERGTGRLPLSEVAKAWLQVLGANAFNEATAKAELKRLKVIDDQGNPGHWVKGIE